MVGKSMRLYKSQFKISFNLVLNVIASNKNIENDRENNTNEYDFNKFIL